MDVAAELRRRAAECFRWATCTQSFAGASAWLNMAQAWLDRAQLAERDELNPAAGRAASGAVAAPNPRGGFPQPDESGEDSGQSTRE